MIIGILPTKRSILLHTITLTIILKHIVSNPNQPNSNPNPYLYVPQNPILTQNWGICIESQPEFSNLQVVVFELENTEQ